MARNVEDLSIFLDAMVGHNKNDPLSSKGASNSYYKNLLKREEAKYLIGFTDDFGICPCDKEVRSMMHHTSNFFVTRTYSEVICKTYKVFSFFSFK